MRILVVNVNTSESMTESIAQRPGVMHLPARDGGAPALFRAEAVDCNFESYLAAVAVMDRVVAYDNPLMRSSWPVRRAWPRRTPGADRAAGIRDL